MLNRRIQQYLDSYGVKFQMLPHAPAFTAGETAHKAHVPEVEMAKTVMIWIDGQLAMAVAPADRQISLERIRQATGAMAVALANESEFKDLFEDCEPGAMPALGNLYGLKVLVDESLAQDDQVAFNAGSHSELIRLAYEDFVKLARPMIGRYTEQPHAIHG